ncbi:MAG TPA: hypothetical protein VGR78_08210 [Verrucomicrobiae bacterium]|nr:hypothetical protein [Verrucomicrobiae bacterium]
MRTKTLLLTAALAAAGIATSKAQVYSVNAVGYVNTTLVPGFNLIANPLDNKNGNIIKDVLKNITPTLPNALQVFKYHPESASFHTAQYDDLALDYTGTAATETLNPGEGVFVKVPGTATLTATFVGEVMQGTLANPVPQGFSILSSQVPQAGTATALGLVGQQGDTLYKWDPIAKAYVTTKFDDLVGDFDKTVNIGVGEAFYYNSKVAKTWNRTFSVSP